MPNEFHLSKSHVEGHHHFHDATAQEEENKIKQETFNIESLLSTVRYRETAIKSNQEDGGDITFLTVDTEGVLNKQWDAKDLFRLAQMLKEQILNGIYKLQLGEVSIEERKIIEDNISSAKLILSEVSIEDREISLHGHRVHHEPPIRTEEEAKSLLRNKILLKLQPEGEALIAEREWDFNAPDTYALKKLFDNLSNAVTQFDDISNKN